MSHLGKLIKTLGEHCPECYAPSLQVRSRTLDNGSEQEYNYCSSCQYEKKLPYKDKGRERGDNKKRNRTENSNGKVGERSIRKNNRQSSRNI